MPIVVLPRRGDPLNQGDILKGLVFPALGVDEKLTTATDAKYLMVVSRPCRAIREKFVVVAAVAVSRLDLSLVKAKMAGKSSDGEPPSLDRMRRYLAGIRDGGQSSDDFYLGNLDSGSPKRYAADLGALATIEVPLESDARRVWIDDHRAWALDVEFARDLHARLFNSYARLGFDDHSWFADPDLEVLVTDGRLQVSAAETALAEAKRALQEKQAIGADTISQGSHGQRRRPRGRAESSERRTRAVRGRADAPRTSHALGLIVRDSLPLGTSI